MIELCSADFDLVKVQFHCRDCDVVVACSRRSLNKASQATQVLKYAAAVATSGTKTLKLVAVPKIFTAAAKIPSFSLPSRKSRPASFCTFCLKSSSGTLLFSLHPRLGSRPPHTPRMVSSHSRSDGKPLCILFELGLRVVSGQECFSCLPAYPSNVNLIVKCNNLPSHPSASCSAWQGMNSAAHARDCVLSLATSSQRTVKQV